MINNKKQETLKNIAKSLTASVESLHDELGYLIDELEDLQKKIEDL